MVMRIFASLVWRAQTSHYRRYSNLIFCHELFVFGNGSGLRPTMFFIFGATGFIGQALQTALTARREPYVGFGSTVCVESDGTTVTQRAVSYGVERERLLRGLPVPNAIVFAAGTAMTNTEAGALQKSHFDSLVAAFRGIPMTRWKDLRFVYTSSSIVYERPSYLRPLLESDPVTPSSAYAEVKLRCENFVKTSIAAAGAQATTARLFNVSGFGHRVGIVAEIAQQAIEI